MQRLSSTTTWSPTGRRAPLAAAMPLACSAARTLPPRQLGRLSNRRSFARTTTVVTQNTARSAEADTSSKPVVSAKDPWWLLRKVAAAVDYPLVKGVDKFLNIKDTQPEEVKSLTKVEIMKCIEYCAWASAAYKTDIDTGITFRIVGDNSEAKESGNKDKVVLSKPLLGKPVLLCGSNQLGLLGVMSDTEALVGLMDGPNGGVEVVLAFRGTSEIRDGVTDIKLDMDPASEFVRSDTDESLRIHSGFKTSANDFLTAKSTLFYGSKDMPDDLKNLYTEALSGKQELSDPEKTALADWNPIDTLENLVEELVKQQASGKKLTKVVCCGHSLGGALATLTAYWCKKVAWPDNTGVEVECYTFGSPRVGNVAFSEEWDKTVLNKCPGRVLRVVHRQDPVPRVPHQDIPPRFKIVSQPYRHVGGGVLLCQPGLNPMVGTAGNPKTWPELSDDKVEGWQAQKRRRPLTVVNPPVYPLITYAWPFLSGDHDLGKYMKALNSSLKNLPSMADSGSGTKKKQ